MTKEEYADLISRLLIAHPDGRIPLAEIPEEVQPKFQGRSFGGVRAGWKNNGDGTVSRCVMNEVLITPKETSNG